MLPLEPFLVERITLPKVWGGRALATVLGIELPADQQIGETWELYDRAEGSSRLRGRTTTLAELMVEPEALVGRGVPLGFGARFPLLLKFLDARDHLSLQVHPDDSQAHSDSGKNEACVVLQAGPKGAITYGFQPGVTRERFAQALAAGDVDGLMATFRPEVGDTIHIPPGTVHAIGPDVVVFEVQQNSDLTYRLFDFGRGREVHIPEAMAVMRVEASPGRPVVAPSVLADGGVQLVATPQFRLRRYSLRQRLDLHTGGRFVTVTAIAGRGTLKWPGRRVHGTLDIATGDTVVVPACTARFTLIPNEHLNVILCDPGER
ncbi:MAG: type I phosphomannose isomerase catalytic subunit [Planctomycetota bacterium]